MAANNLYSGKVLMGQTYQSIVIRRPVETVWAAIRNFHEMSWAPNVITSLQTVGDAHGLQAGAGRVLNGVFRETLREISEAERTFRYSIDDGPSPVSADEVSDYVGQVTVRPVTEDGGTFVEWSSSWKKNDDPVHDFCHGIYVALLRDMKRSLEAQHAAASS